MHGEISSRSKQPLLDSLSIENVSSSNHSRVGVWMQSWKFFVTGRIYVVHVFSPEMQEQRECRYLDRHVKISRVIRSNGGNIYSALNKPRHNVFPPFPSLPPPLFCFLFRSPGLTWTMNCNETINTIRSSAKHLISLLRLLRHLPTLRQNKTSPRKIVLTSSSSFDISHISIDFCIESPRTTPKRSPLIFPGIIDKIGY